MNPGRAKLRRILAITFVLFLAPILPVLLFVVKTWTEPAFMLVVVNTLMAGWLVIDAALLHHYMKKVRRIHGAVKTIDFTYAFFIKGISWTFAREDALYAEKLVHNVLQRARPFPRLDIRRVLDVEGLERACTLVVHAERESASNAKEAEERARRGKRREREAAQLLRRGIELGISEDMMRRLIARGNLDSARVAIAEKEREKDLLERAGRNFCAGMVHTLMQSGHLNEAEAVVLKAESLIGRATALGVAVTVCLHLDECHMSLAEKTVIAAEKLRRFESVVEGFELRIATLPEPRQPEARTALERFVFEQFETRESRVVLHELQQILER